MICKICDCEKAASEFYDKDNGTSVTKWNVCKTCWKERQKTYKHRQGVKNRSIPSWSSEGDVIDLLLSIGIWATPGKGSIYSHVDIVAWGCVRIEVKTSAVNADGVYGFRFGPKQVRNGVDADFVVLTFINLPEENIYCVLPKDHPCLYNTSGRIRSAVLYRPSGGRGDQALSSEVIDQYRNAWHQIEERRLQISQQLLFSYAGSEEH